MFSRSKGISLRERLKKEEVKRRVGVRKISSDKIREARLMWNGHVVRRNISYKEGKEIASCWKEIKGSQMLTRIDMINRRATRALR